MPEPSEGPFDGYPDVRRRTVEVSRTTSDVRDHAELGGEDDPVAPILEGAAHKLFVGVGAIDLGGVDEGDAEIQGAVNRSDGLGLIDAGVDVGRGHAHRS